MPLDKQQFHPRSNPSLTFDTFQELKKYLQDTGEIKTEEDSVLYKVSWIPQTPDPETFVWDLK